MFKEPFQIGNDPKAVLKDGYETLNYINQCWVMLPEVLRSLPQPTLISYAEQVANSIRRFSNSHMLSFTVGQALDHMINKKALILVDPQQEEVLGFAKLYAWKNKENQTVGWEFGSLFVHPNIRQHHVAQYLTEQLVAYKQQEISNDSSQTPIFAVVTVDNPASLKLFRRMKWRQTHPSANETAGYNMFEINGVNIFEDWGKESVVFYYQNKIGG